MKEKPEFEFRYLNALTSIEALMKKCACPLSDEQKLILAGALAVWVPGWDRAPEVEGD